MDIKIHHQKITPELAKKYLERNKRNRHINKNTVDFYVAQMRQNQWLPTGDPIKFSKKGNLLDGQHRLSAIVQYGHPVDMFVAEGLEDETFKVIDTGKSRSASDVVAMLGVKHATTMAGAVRAIIMFRRGSYYDPKKRKAGVSNSDILDFIHRHKQIQEQVVFVTSLYTQFRAVPASGLCMLYHVLSKHNQTKADTFFSKYATGIDLSAKSPIYALRNRLLSDYQNKSKLTYRDKLALVVYAWNAYIKNKEIGIVKLVGNYKFPTPV